MQSSIQSPGGLRPSAVRAGLRRSQPAQGLYRIAKTYGEEKG
jgi:hypothetical protein